MVLPWLQKQQYWGHGQMKKKGKLTWWTCWTTRTVVTPFLCLHPLASLLAPASGPVSIMGCTRCQPFASGRGKFRVPVAAWESHWVSEEHGAGFLPNLSEQRTSSKTLLGSRLTSVSHCFPVSFTMHDLCCIFSFYLFGSKKWVGRKCSLESHRRVRRNGYHL